MANKKLTISNSNEQYEVIAIASSLQDYRVSFFINQQIHTNFIKANDLVVDDKRKSVIYKFNAYTYFDEISEFNYLLISNKTSNGVFFNSVKHFDYLLIIKYTDEVIDIGHLIDKLRQIDDFQAVLPMKNIKKKELQRITEFL